MRTMVQFNSVLNSSQKAQKSRELVTWFARNDDGSWEIIEEETKWSEEDGLNLDSNEANDWNVCCADHE